MLNVISSNHFFCGFEFKSYFLFLVFIIKKHFILKHCSIIDVKKCFLINDRNDRKSFNLLSFAEGITIQ